MEVFGFHANVIEVFGEILGKFFGKGRDENAAALVCFDSDLFETIVDLARGGTDFDRGVEKPRWPDDLLDDIPLRLLDFPLSGCGRYIDDLTEFLISFLEFKRAIVESGRKAESEFDQGLLAGAIAIIHGMELGQRLVRLVDNEEEVVGEVVDEAWRRGSWVAAAEVAGVVFDPLAITYFADHFEIVAGPLFDALRFDEPIFAFEEGDSVSEFLPDRVDGLIADVFRGDIVRAGINRDLFKALADFACEGIDLAQSLDLVSEKLDSIGEVVFISGDDFKNIASGAEGGADKIVVVASVVHFDKVEKDVVAADLLFEREGEKHLAIVLGSS